MSSQPSTANLTTPRILRLACWLVLLVYGLMIDLKGISTDEGIRLYIVNGGLPFGLGPSATTPTWAMVVDACSPFAYQPLYFLIQNTVMRLTQSHNEVLFRIVNLFFLWVSLRGLLTLSRNWAAVPRLFLIVVFSFNAYLLMHVLQIREYIVGIAFYIWSSWLVLKLDNRPLGRLRADLAWFVGYGLLLTLGFYTQTWIVFPAIGQFLFLVVRPPAPKGRFFAHLAISYGIVLWATWSYLDAHQQKMEVGRWGVEQTALWPQLSNGFHLVLTGHEAGKSAFADFLFWFWLAVILSGVALVFLAKTRSISSLSPGETKRVGTLMLFSILVPLIFQIGYFVRVDNLSLWPRYFVVHYFFLFWLVALTFKLLWDIRAAPEVGAIWRRGSTAALVAMGACLGASAFFQVGSYYRDPWFDTGMRENANWRSWSADLLPLLHADDAVLTDDFLGRATLSFTRPMSNRIVALKELENQELKSAGRLIYLEAPHLRPQRDRLAARVAALGFGGVREETIHPAPEDYPYPKWHFVIFSRQ